MKTKLLATVPVLALAAGAVHAETVSGVVTNVNTEQKTITVRNDETGKRRTYFIDDDSRLSSQSSDIRLSQVRKGNTVTLRYRPSDSGRVVETIRLPDLADIVDVVPVVTTSVQSVSGRVTGVRPLKRTITIRDDETRQRRTLRLVDETALSRNGETVSIRSIQKGDRLSARYRITDRGLIMVTGRAPEAVSAPVAERSVAEPVALPKTAGQVFAYLFLGLGLVGTSLAMRLFRKRS